MPRPRWRDPAPEDPPEQPAGPVKIAQGGPHRQLRAPDAPPHPSESCPDCREAKADPTNPRDHCPAHSHVIRPQEAR